VPNELVAEFLYENTSTIIDHYIVRGCAFATIELITTKNRRETSNAQRRTSNSESVREQASNAEESPEPAGSGNSAAAGSYQANFQPKWQPENVISAEPSPHLVPS